MPYMADTETVEELVAMRTKKLTANNNRLAGVIERQAEKIKELEGRLKKLQAVRDAIYEAQEYFD